MPKGTPKTFVPALPESAPSQEISATQEPTERPEAKAEVRPEVKSPRSSTKGRMSPEVKEPSDTKWYQGEFAGRFKWPNTTTCADWSFP